MDNVPSSAIMAIIAIVAACLIGAFIFTTVQSQKESGNAALTKVEGMNNQLDEADLTQYDGATVTGSQVKAAIKLLKDQQVSIKVINKAGDDTGVQYNYTLNNTTLTKLIAKGQTAKTDTTDSAIAEESADNTATFVTVPTSKNNPGYITPSAQFTGSIHRNEDTNVIDQITFTRISQ